MRVFSCNLCLPSTCSPKSSPVVYSPSVLQSGSEVVPSSDGRDVAERLSCGDCALEGTEKRPLVDRAIEGDLVDGECHEELDRCGGEIVLKSSLKKPREPGVEVRKGRVKWMDILGKELVVIHEFEASESEDSDVDCSNRGCSCVIHHQGLWLAQFFSNALLGSTCTAVEASCLDPPCVAMWKHKARTDHCEGCDRQAIKKLRRCSVEWILI